MKERTYGIVLGILNIVLLVTCGVFFWGKDKNAPEILLPSADFVYATEADEDVLFQGVVAFDEEDGDLTDSVVIEKIVTDVEKETATITYGVADNAGNVGKATCTIEMQMEESTEVVHEALEQSEGNAEKSETEGEETDLEEETEEIEEDIEETDDTESEEEFEENPEETDDAESEEEAEEGNEEETTEEEEKTSTENRNENQVQTVESGQDTGRPSMVLKSQEIRTKVGSGPAWVNVIEGLHDDKDNYETLLKSLKVNGNYDKDKAGSYNVTVTVTDGEGNESNAYPMKIIVEAWE